MRMTCTGCTPRPRVRRPAACWCTTQPRFKLLKSTSCPSEADLKKAMTDVAENVRALVKAPIGEAYTGPVLFEPRAAAQLFAQLLGDNLRVPRKPITDPGRNVNFLPSELETRYGSRVLPDWFDVTDDSTQMASNGKPLVGLLPVRYGRRET